MYVFLNKKKISRCFRTFSKYFQAGGFQPVACGPHVALHLTLTIFSSPFDVDCTITTADRIHWSSLIKRFQVQVSFWPHLQEPCPSIRMIPQPYHIHPPCNEHICHNILLWRIVLQNEAYQEYTVITSLVIWCASSVNLFIECWYYTFL